MRILVVVSILIVLLLAGAMSGGAGAAGGASASVGAGAGPLDDVLKAFERKDYAAAHRLVKPLAEKGSAKAQNLLGYMYQAGRGVGKDYAEAMNWYRKAAEQGNPDAMFNLGVMFESGQGMSQNHVLAHMWFNLAASRYPASRQESREDAIRSRDKAAGRMSADRVAQAQKLAREWQPGLSASPGAPPLVRRGK